MKSLRDHLYESITAKDVVDFGNWLLSRERDEMTSELNKENVTDADFANFADLTGAVDLRDKEKMPGE